MRTSSPRSRTWKAAAADIRERLGFGGEAEAPVRLREIELPPPRLEAPGSLAEIVGVDRRERVSHALGKAYRDVVRGFRGEIEHVLDVVARPRDEVEIEAVLSWCADVGAAAIPHGADQRRRRGRAARRKQLRGRRRTTSARSTACSRSTGSLRAARPRLARPGRT